MVGEDFGFSLIRDERPLTEHVHLAFAASDDATVRAFHAAALAAGYRDNGAPGERAVYHAGYYGAFVLARITAYRIESTVLALNLRLARGGRCAS